MISIIIVSLNVSDLLKKCLQSIYGNPLGAMAEVFVVDNASKDDSVAMVRQNFPAVHLIANTKNVGFAAANNQALGQTTGDYVLFLNPDTEIYPDTLEQSVAFMKEHPACGVMGCQLLYGDGLPQPSIRRFPSWWPIFLMFLKLPKIFPHLKAIDYYLATDFDYSKETTVDQVMGAFMFTKKEVLGKVGGLDERFFVWFDDTDFCLRIWQAGYQAWYAPHIKITHYLGKAFSQQKVVTKQWRFFTSAWRYFRKHGLWR